MSLFLGEETKTFVVDLSASFNAQEIANRHELYQYNPDLYYDYNEFAIAQSGHSSVSAYMADDYSAERLVVAGDVSFVLGDPEWIADYEGTDNTAQYWFITGQRRVYLIWSAAVGNEAAGNTYTPYEVGSIYYNQRDEFITGLSASNSLKLTVTVTYNKYAYIDLPLAVDKFYQGYLHSDPYGSIRTSAQIYYKVTDVSMECVPSVGDSVVITADPSGMDNVNNRLFSANIDVTDNSPFLVNYINYLGVHPTPLSDIGSVSISGDGMGTTDINVTNTKEVSSNPAFYCKLEITGNNLKLSSTGCCGTPADLNIYNSLANCGYSGYILDCDETPREGMDVEAIDTAFETSDKLHALTDTIGNVSIPRTYGGRWDYLDISVNERVYFDDAPPTSYGINAVKNLWAKEEFNFDNQVYNPNTNPDWGPFDDGGIKLHIPGLEWKNACSLSIAPYKQRIAFDSASGWTVLPAGAATLSVVGGALQVVVAAGSGDVTVSKTYTSPKPTLTGAHFLNLDFITADTNAIGIDINGTVAKDVKVPVSVTTKGSETIDMVGDIISTALVDTTQGFDFGAGTGFGWGVQSVSSIAFSKLKRGVTYIFKGLTQVLGGTPTTYIYDGAFVADVPGDGRASDAHSLFSDTRQEGSVVKSRIGVVLDPFGFVLADVFGMNHVAQASKWLHAPIPVNDTAGNVIYPTDGLVTFTPAEQGVNGWQDPTQFFTCDIVPGVYLGASVPLTLKPAVSLMMTPESESHAFTFRKYYRGDICLRLFNQDGTPASSGVTCKVYDKSTSDDAVSTITKTADNGVVWLNQVNAPCVDKGTIVSISSDGLTVTASGISIHRDYAGHTLYMSPLTSDYVPESATIDTITYIGDTATITLTSALANKTTTGSLWITKNYIYEISTQGSGDALVGRISARNRAVTFLTIKGVIPANASDVDIRMRRQTGECLLAYILDSSIVATRSIDDAVTFTAAETVTSTAGACKPRLFFSSKSSRWGIVWTEGITAKIAWSIDGFKTKTESMLMDGVKNVCPATNEQTGVIMFTGWRVSDGTIIAWRTIDDCATETTPVVVATLPEQAPSICFSAQGIAGWIIAVTDSGGALKRYKSFDNGVTWNLIS